jgi:hypothetical protein
VTQGRRRRGQALVEFALVAPVFFLILLAVIEGGRFMLLYQALGNATREGARYAIVHGSNSFCPSGPMPPGIPDPGGCYDQSGANVVDQVEASAFGLLSSDLTVTTTWGPLGNAREAEVTVAAAYAYRPLLPLPVPPINVEAESTLVINN